MTRPGRRSLVGERLVAYVPHGHWKTNTIISAIGLRGAFATAVFDSPTDTDVFGAYVEQVLSEELRIDNGLVEGRNNKAKVVSHRCYGFQTAKTYIMALYHCLGHLPESKLMHRFL